ncbi:MAG: hypothetical protein IKS79_05605 [Bacteroidales bacterium]|nr:hypothetical protein [Bacteroidales bacterium]
MNADFCNLVRESLPEDAAERLLCALKGTEAERLPSELQGDGLQTTEPAPTIRINPFKKVFPINHFFTSSSSSDEKTVADVKSVSKEKCALEVLEGAEELWCKGAFKLAERPDFTLDPSFHAGAYYVQDSSSMFPYLIADEIDSALGESGVLLDLCAAPGGKSTHLLSLFAKEGRIILSNEAVPKRIPALTDNLAKWGVSRLIATNRDPKNLGRLEGLFDVILADVPCSGEGMFMRSSDALNDWSLRTVEECAVRQRSIISDIWPALKEGGLLVYSTCTYNHKENSDNVRYIIEELGAEYVPVDKVLAEVPGLLKLDYGYQFALGSVMGEGQFFAVLRKRSAAASVGSAQGNCNNAKDNRISKRTSKNQKSFRELKVKIVDNQKDGKNFGDVDNRENCDNKENRESEVESKSFFFNRADETIYMMPSDVAERMITIAEAIEGTANSNPIKSGKSQDCANGSSFSYVKMIGCKVGTVKGGKVIPDADFALSTELQNALQEGMKDKSIAEKDSCIEIKFEELRAALQFFVAEVDRGTALRFLARENITPHPKWKQGYILLCYKGLGLGFVNNLGNRCNNLYPQERRIRKSI